MTSSDLLGPVPLHTHGGLCWLLSPPAGPLGGWDSLRVSWKPHLTHLRHKAAEPWSHPRVTGFLSEVRTLGSELIGRTSRDCFGNAWIANDSQALLLQWVGADTSCISRVPLSSWTPHPLRCKLVLSPVSLAGSEPLAAPCWPS